MTAFHVNSHEVGIFLSILLRVSLVFFMVPVFSGAQVPSVMKAGISLALSAFFFPYLHAVVIPLPLEAGPMVLAVMGEILLAMVLSLSMLMILAAFQSAGELISVEMGLGFAQVVDPQGGVQVMLFSRWFQLLAILLLLSINGHHLILKAIVQSFRTIPIGGFVLNDLGFARMIALGGHLFIVALKIAAPVLIVLMLMNVGLGLIAKFSPQINVLMTSFPLTIFVGLLFMGFSISVWCPAIEQFLAHILEYLQTLTR
jgi:flagellar biosynthetic protein FliR